MSASNGWQFALEIHPPAWRFPAGSIWLAGWIQSDAGTTITDVRARLDHRVILGLCGLPHPAFPQASTTETAGPGFSFFLAPHSGATLLRLEARDQTGRWREFFRTEVSSGAEVSAHPPARNFISALPSLATALIKQQRRAMQAGWEVLSDELLAAFVAEPLDVDPSWPFVGALEEPQVTGRLRYGLVPVTGWLAHSDTRIARLSARVDPSPAVSLGHDRARRDIPSVFPAAGGRLDTGFVGEVILPPGLAEPVLLKIFAELTTGETHLVFARRFIPRFHGTTGEMPPLVTRQVFVRAIWALHRSAGRHLLPRAGLIRKARSLWTEYRSIPAYRPSHDLPFTGTKFFSAERSSPDPSATVVAPAPPDSPDCTVIAPDDDMQVPHSAQYFSIGREALVLVQEAIALAGPSNVNAILDLPCGSGRVARWLRTAYPSAQLTVCDIQRSAVDFCIAQLGARGVTAVPDGSHWGALPGPYDVIWCGSLFTHFNQDEWVNHLRRFAARLSPHGVIVLTAHGLPALEKLQSGEKDYGLSRVQIGLLCAAAVAKGFGFAAYPESPAYGISISQPSWIKELIARETDLHVLAYHAAAWDQHQDVFVCGR